MNSAGEAWKTFYQSGSLSWHDPEKINYDRLVRFSKSEWIRSILKPLPAQTHKKIKILEAGCGTGMYAAALSIRGFEVDAFDYNEEALQIAKEMMRKISREGRALDVRFRKDNLLHMQYESNRYDIVFNQAVLEYFSKEDRVLALEEMQRVTKPGGWVVVIVQHTAHPFGKFWRRIGWKGYTDQPPVMEITPEILWENLNQAGLTDISTDCIYPWKAFFFWPPWYQKWKWTSEIVYLMGRALEHVPLPRILRAALALQIIGMGRKP